MCIVDRITFPTCTHTSHIPLYPCKSGFSTPKSTCNASTPIVRKYLSSTTTPCPHCYNSTLLSIRTDHARTYLDLDREARSLGWSSADIRGSLLEIQADMDAAVAEWKAACGRESDDNEMKLDSFAESIRFQFGPEPVMGGERYLFHAGNGVVFTDPFAGRKGARTGGKARQTTRVKVLKGEGVAVCNIAAPWCGSRIVV